MKIKLKIPVAPIAKERPRTVKTDSGVKTFTPKKTKDFENMVGLIARQQMGSLNPSEKAIKATFIFSLTVPSSWKENERTNALCGFIKNTKKPDLDNMVKSCLDACNGIVFKDDAQVCFLTAQKTWSPEPSIEIIFEEI